MNPFANEYIPASLLSHLWDYPFFQQRFEQFMRSAFKKYDASTKDLKVLMISPPLHASSDGKTPVFLADYKGIPIVYEAKQWQDPRTGTFLTAVATVKTA